MIQTNQGVSKWPTLLGDINAVLLFCFFIFSLGIQGNNNLLIINNGIAFKLNYMLMSSAFISSWSYITILKAHNILIIVLIEITSTVFNKKLSYRAKLISILNSMNFPINKIYALIILLMALYCWTQISLIAFKKTCYFHSWVQTFWT